MFHCAATHKARRLFNMTNACNRLVAGHWCRMSISYTDVSLRGSANGHALVQHDKREQYAALWPNTVPYRNRTYKSATQQKLNSSTQLVTHMGYRYFTARPRSGGALVQHDKTE
jgi:hypothetical protein